MKLDVYENLDISSLPVKIQEALDTLYANHKMAQAAIKAHLDNLLPTNYHAVVSVKVKWGKVGVGFKATRMKSKAAGEVALPTKKIQIIAG
jgi:hypothetical protein